MAAKRARFSATPARQVKLELLEAADPSTMTILKNETGGQPVLVGTGSLAYVCPKCGAIQCKGVEAGQIRHIVFQCGCGAFGRVTSPDVV